MEELKQWMFDQLGQKRADPYTHLGKTIKYFLNRWDKLFRFLSEPGVTLSNSAAEHAIQEKHSQVRLAAEEWLTWKYLQNLAG